mgnify:CR=1 FL=1
MYAPTFRVRRQLSLLLTAIALAVVAMIVWVQESRLAHTSFFTGTLLLGSILILMLLGVRRRIPVLAVGNVSTWTQIHIYTAIFSIGIYALHVPALIGGGVFESGLSILFLSVAASGFYGLFASLTIPRQLTAIQGEQRFDQIPWYRQQIALKAGQLLKEIAEQTSAGVIERLYEAELEPYFSSGPSVAYLAVPSGRRRRRLLSNLKEVDRYLESEGRATAGQFSGLVRRRDDLDYQYAMQLRLRLWLVFHCLLSVALVAAGIIHATIAWRFAG